MIGSPISAAEGVRLAILADAIAAREAGDKHGESALWKALEHFGTKRPDDVEAYVPTPPIVTTLEQTEVVGNPLPLLPIQRHVCGVTCHPDGENCNGYCKGKELMPGIIDGIVSGSYIIENHEVITVCAACQKEPPAAESLMCAGCLAHAAAAHAAKSSATEKKQEEEKPATGLLAKAISAAKTVKLRKALLKLQEEDKPDSVKQAQAAALIAAQ